MKLLIVTQKVDMHDDVLGFFHSWIAEFARQCGRVTVICLEKGEYDLPDNVKVLSLGKEKKRSRRSYLALFYKYIWQERRNYDAVFVHMNPVYVALAGPLWVAWRKKIALWYIHPKIDRYLKAAHLFTDIIFTASSGSFPFPSPKVRAVGHGIDTERFTPLSGAEKEKNSILYVGRITPIKRLDVLVEAVRILEKKNIPIALHLIGGPDVRYADYYARFRENLADLQEKGIVAYHGQIPNTDMPKWYNAYEVLVNVTPSGSFDKTVLEAMASGTLAVTSNSNFASLVPSLFFVKEGDSKSLAYALASVFSLSDAEKRDYARMMRDRVVAGHNLQKLIAKIKDALK